MSGQASVGQKPPPILRRPWYSRLIIDPLFRVGSVRQVWWADFYRYCLHQVDPAVAIYSISGSGEFTQQDPDGPAVIDELLSQENDRCWYAIMECEIEQERRDELQKKASEGRWSGKLDFLKSRAIQSHLVICADHLFLEAPHTPGAPAEDRPGVMISHDPLLLDAARETYNRILQDESTKRQWELTRCRS